MELLRTLKFPDLTRGTDVAWTVLFHNDFSPSNEQPEYIILAYEL